MALGSLSTRQADVLRRVCAGQSDDAIAGELGVSPATIRGYRGRIRRRFGDASMAAVCRLLEGGDAPRPPREAPDAAARAGDPFPGYRVEHHAGDGTVRQLAGSTLESVAMQSAHGWARLLRGHPRDGTVVVIASGAAEPLLVGPVGPG